MHAIAVLALLAAQHIYGPFEAGPRDRAPVVAAAPHGLLIAWSEIESGARVASIHTALFNHDAQRIGPVHKLASTRANVHATTPAIVTDGEKFFVAWLERDRHGHIAREVAGVLTDGTGSPLRGTESFGAAVAGAPSLVWFGLEYRLFGEKNYSISPAGDVKIVNFGVTPQRVPFATPDANGWIDWSTEPAGRPCISFCGGILPSPPASHFDFAIVTRDWIRSGRIRETGYHVGTAPVVEATENDLFVVWSTPHGLKAQRIDDGHAARSFTLADPRARDAALSMAGSLVVFDSGFDIFGTIVTGDSFGSIFPISTGEELDSQPRVVRVGEHRYLVTWLRNGAHIAAQFVATEP